MITSSQERQIRELQKNIRIVDNEFNGMSNSHREARHNARKEYLDFLNEIGATKSDLFKMQYGKAACCDNYIPEVIKYGNCTTVADGSRFTTKNVIWCSNCGSLIEGGSVREPKRDIKGENQ